MVIDVEPAVLKFSTSKPEIDAPVIFALEAGIKLSVPTEPPVAVPVIVPVGIVKESAPVPRVTVNAVPVATTVETPVPELVTD